MNRKDFFQKEASDIKRNDILTSLEGDSVDILNEKFLWVCKINENEMERESSLRHKAQIILGIHITLASLLLSGTVFGFFSIFTTNSMSMLIISGGITFILGSIISGVLYSLTVAGIPRFINVLDPTLTLESYKSQDEWLRVVVVETLLNYKKNLKVIGSSAFRTRISSDFLILAVFATLLTLIIASSFLFVNDIKLDNYIILGSIGGFVIVIIAISLIIHKPRSYEKTEN